MQVTKYLHRVFAGLTLIIFATSAYPAVGEEFDNFQTYFGKEFTADDIVFSDDGAVFVIGTKRFRTEDDKHDTTKLTQALYAKFDVEGNLLWSNECCLDGNTVAETAQRTPDEHYLVVVGYSQENSRGVYVLRIDQFGELVWSSALGVSAAIYVHGVVAVADGGIIALLRSEGSPGLQLMKIAEDRSTSWTQTVSGSQGRLAVDTQGDIYVDTTIVDLDQGTASPSFHKFSQGGEKRWSLEINDDDLETNQTGVNDFVISENVILGVALSRSDNFAKGMVFGISTDGELLWRHLVDSGDPFGVFSDIALKTGEGFYASGWSGSGSGGLLAEKGWLAEFSSTGDLIWQGKTNSGDRIEKVLGNNAEEILVFGKFSTDRDCLAQTTRDKIEMVPAIKSIRPMIGEHFCSLTK